MFELLECKGIRGVGKKPPRLCLMSCIREETTNMKCILAFLAVLILLCGPTLADDLKKLNLDDASALGTTIQTDLKVKTEGRGSVKITTLHPTTVCLGEVTGLDIENAKIIYKAKVKSNLNGIAFLEMWAYVGAGQYYSRGINDPIKGNSDWKSIQTPFILQKGQNCKRVTLNLVINGNGTVWIDDVILSKAPLE